MSEATPFAVLMVRNATIPNHALPSYAQILSEVEAGRLSFDADLMHENVWLLDEAIQARLKNVEGARIFAKNNGADPSMDQLWARWASTAQQSCLGSERDQAIRMVRLMKLGSSKCLDAFLSRRQLQFEEKDYDAAWLNDNLSLVSRSFWSIVIDQDMQKTMEVLLKWNIGMRMVDPKCHPFIKVRSARATSLLLRHHIPMPQLEGETIIEATADRDLPAHVIKDIIEVFVSEGGISHTKEARLNLMARNLAEKTAQQFLGEAEMADWQPSSRPMEFSPVATWAERYIGRSDVNLVEGGALAWLRRQSSHGKVLPGKVISEAKLTWACLFPHKPTDAEEHALVASDMVKPEKADRIKDFYKFLNERNQLEGGCFEKAIGRIFMELGWKRNEDRTVSDLLEGLFSGGGDTTWILHAIRNNPHVSLSLESILVEGSKSSMGGHAMALTIALASAVQDRRIIKTLNEKWAEGVRPHIKQGDVEITSQNLHFLDKELASQFQAWSISCFSSPVSRSRPHNRL